jgi:hypothetical protein
MLRLEIKMFRYIQTRRNEEKERKKENKEGSFSFVYPLNALMFY